MTSERILLGNHVVKPELVFPETPGRRTSRPESMPLGFNEMTASVVWGTISDSGYDPRQFAIWNAYPWHPYQESKIAEKGMLTNRTPKPAELRIGMPFLKEFLRICNPTHVFAVGDKSLTTLKALGLPNKALRHPAFGGANIFRNQFLTELKDIVDLAKR